MESTTRPELSFDGKGINGPDEHRSRIATFEYYEAAWKYGNLFAAAPDLEQQVWALANGWSVRKASLYDEEGVEGWVWESPSGTEYAEIGDWSELPPWSDELRSVITKARGGA